MATPTAGTKLSLGKLGRATAVDNSDYTSKTSLNSCARDSSTGKASLGDFYISAVVNELTGYGWVDEQTNETYEVTFTNANSLFTSRIATRAKNFTWTTSNSGLFALQSSATRIAQYNAGAIADNTTPIGVTFESNLVTDHDFNNWTSANLLGDWDESGGTVISQQPLSSQSPSGSNLNAVLFNTQDGYIEQTFTVKGNSTYQIRALVSSSNSGEGNLECEISGAYHQETFKSLAGHTEWREFREDFYTSGSAGVNQTLKLKFTAVSASTDHKPLLDTVFFERWEGAHFSDTNVTITGKYHDDGQSDGFNDHATRYNTAISKVVEIQDTYGGLAIACFLPETLVRMADGSDKKIEDLYVGDEVLSIKLEGLPDEDLGYSAWKEFTMLSVDDMTTMETATAKIEKIFYDYMDGYWDINNGLIKVTSEHDFWTFADHLFGPRWEWNTPLELSGHFGTSQNKTPYYLMDTDGKKIEIESIEYIDGEVEVINIDVEPLDIYFAGGVLVHNKGASSEP